MSFIYCDTCNVNFLKKEYLSHHHHQNKKHPLIVHFPMDIINIIDDYKNDIELYENYHKFYIFIDFFIHVKPRYPLEFSCYSGDHYMKDILQILNYEIENFKDNYCVRHYNHKGTVSETMKRKIFKIYLFQNPNTKKYFVEIL
tara:strand:+ start:2071 stop:2499 length:429 start_codon:yes stop_codon:yes gene_type:complete